MNADFEFILQNDEIRRRITGFIPGQGKKTDLHSLDYMNINLAYGVRSKEHGIFVTLIYYVYRGIMQTDYLYDWCDYIVLHGNDTFTVHTMFDRRKGFGEFSIAPQYRHLESFVREAIVCYEDWKKLRSFTDGYEKNDPKFRIYRLRDDILKKYYGEEAHQ